MIPVAVILILLVVTFTVAVLVSNPEVSQLSIFGAKIDVTDGGVFFTGAATMLVLIAALGLLWRGLKRQRARRQEIRSLKAAAGNGTSAATPVSSKKQKPATLSEPSTTADATPTSSHSDTGSASRSDTGSGSRSSGAATTSTSGNAPETTPAERSALLDEAEHATDDGPQR